MCCFGSLFLTAASTWLQETCEPCSNACNDCCDGCSDACSDFELWWERQKRKHFGAASQSSNKWSNQPRQQTMSVQELAQHKSLSNTIKAEFDHALH